MTKVRDISRFIGLIYYYRDMWRKRAHTLYTLKKLCSNTVKFKFTDVEHKAFTETKKIVGHNILLYHPNFI